MEPSPETKRFTPKRRPSIHHSSTDNDDKIVSKSTDRSQDMDNSRNSTNFSSKDSDNDSGNEEKENSQKEDLKKENSINEMSKIIPEASKDCTMEDARNSLIIWKLSAIVVVLGLVALRYGFGNPTETRNNLNAIIEEFPLQEKTLFTYFDSGVQDTITFQKPSVFMLLHEETATATMSKLLQKLSNYSLCKVTECSKEAIQLTNADLNAPEIINDYGKIIEKYRDKLEVSGVMVVPNLENVESEPAQVFHSICDEYTPLVHKAIIIFTLKVDKLPSEKENMKFVTSFLKNKWSRIKPDILNALITRITNMILHVKAEN